MKFQAYLRLQRSKHKGLHRNPLIPNLERLRLSEKAARKSDVMILAPAEAGKNIKNAVGN